MFWSSIKKIKTHQEQAAKHQHGNSKGAPKNLHRNFERKI